MCKVSVVVGVAGLSVFCACSMKTVYYTEQDKLVAYNWILHAYEGKAIDLQSFPNGAPALRFTSDSTLVLFTGCEHMKGYYKLDENYFDIAIDTQRVTCKIPATENLIHFLNLSNRFVLSKEKLLIILDSTEVLSFFEK
jgi:hypothetical protein